MKTEKWSGDGYTLKRCPFCGGPPEEYYPQDTNSNYWKIECQFCGATIKGTHRYMNQEAWNKRYPICEE